MKIADFSAQTDIPPVITYRGGPVGPGSDFEDAVDAHLYVRNQSFLGWFLRPESHLSDGGFAVRAYAGDDLIGIAMLNGKAWLFQSAYHPDIDEKAQKLLGMVGFFVKQEHRAHGVAVSLAKQLEREILKRYRDPRKPVVVCTGAACSVASRAFTKVTVVPVK